jgi:hypothetical protein
MTSEFPALVQVAINGGGLLLSAGRVHQPDQRYHGPEPLSRRLQTF